MSSNAQHMLYNVYDWLDNMFFPFGTLNQREEETCDYCMFINVTPCTYLRRLHCSVCLCASPYFY